jgi:hypothetical protein
VELGGNLISDDRMAGAKESGEYAVGNNDSILLDDDPEEEPAEQEEDYKLKDCTATHTCIQGGEQKGWCLFADGHDGQHRCGRCGTFF